MNDETLYRYFRGAAAPLETEEILKWLEDDPAAQGQFDAAHTLFNLAEISKARAEGLRTSRRAGFGRWIRAALTATASAAAAVLVGVVAFNGGRSEEKKSLASVYNVLEVPNGKTVNLELNDGTKVTLNGGSRLEYPVVFAEDHRSVNLSGQAIFSVSHNDKCPFVVNTFAYDVTVLGTRFEVLADSLDGAFSTSLFEGSVKVMDKQHNTEVFLCPDQKVYMKDGRLLRAAIDTKDEYMWPDGIISIGGVDFCTLMARFERAFGVNIEICREDMPVLNFISGKMYVCEGIENALKTLQKGCDFSYTLNQSDNSVTIR